MDGEEGGGIRLSKRFSDGGEVDYKTKSGTAWSHSYLNQKPWHPLSYPNQRRKWIAEQTHAHRQRRAEEVAREYAQEQDFYRQTALISKKEKEKVELMQAVSFMYVRPPGYNAESAKAAELAEEKRQEELSKGPQESNDGGQSSSMQPLAEEKKKKPRPKDVFGRPLPTEEEFEVLKNAPKLETGVAGRVKPFGVEIRNVKCLRCGTYGHQSGDRECPLKDAIMPNEESRLKRDDPLNAIIAHTDPSEPLKWELKQKPGISPPRGGFRPDDPNQQIVAEDEEIFDEYGGFLTMDNIPDLLTNFSKKPKKSKKSKSKRKKRQLNSESEASSDDEVKRSKKKKAKVNKKKQDYAKISSSDSSEFEKDQGKSRDKSSYSSEDSDSDMVDRSRKTKHQRSDRPSRKSKHDTHKHSVPSEGSDHDDYHDRYKNSDTNSYSSEDSYSEGDDRSRKNRRKLKRKHDRKRHSYSSDSGDLGPTGHHGNHKGRDEHSYSSDNSNHQRHYMVKRNSHKNPSIAHCDSKKHNRNNFLDRRHESRKSRSRHSYSSKDSDDDKDDRSRKIKQKDRYNPQEHPRQDMSKESRKKHCYSSKDSAADGYHRSEKRRYERSHPSESDNSDQPRYLRSSHKH